MSPLARWISIVGHPFVMIGLLVGMAARQRSARMAGSIAIVAIFTVVPLLALMIRQVRRGAWHNADASNIHERPTLYRVGLAGLVGLLIFLRMSQPQSFLVRGVVPALGMFAVCAVLTRWVKVSLHMAFAAFAASALAFSGSVVGWALMAFLPVLGWSRFVLGRHHAGELVLGLAIGAGAGIALSVV